MNELLANAVAGDIKEDEADGDRADSYLLVRNASTIEGHITSLLQEKQRPFFGIKGGNGHGSRESEEGMSLP